MMANQLAELISEVNAGLGYHQDYPLPCLFGFPSELLEFPAAISLARL